MTVLSRLAPVFIVASLLAPARAQLASAPSWRELGPANMSGRIVDIDMHPEHRATWYAATASGGLWKTVNAGTTWAPVFEKENTISLGAVAVSPADPNVVWVGTGEGNPRNSVSWGDGVYVSADGGTTWEHAGLKDSFQIGCIAAHPKDANVAFVAACGRLWGEGGERGLYRTRDGGTKWERVLHVDAKTGGIDVIIDPTDPATVYAATWERQRDAFDSNDPAKRWGPGSGLWKSTDGGSQWRRLTRGLPTVALGRVGLALAASDPSILYAVVETERIGWATGSEKAPVGEDGKPHKGYGTRLGGQVANVQDEQGEDGFETGGIFRSSDRGESWERVNSINPRPFYFSRVRVDPTDPDRVCVLGIHYHVSIDGGKEFKAVRDHGIHVDFHDMWIDPENPKHWLMASDGGLYETWDLGENYRFFDNLPCGQFYNVAVDDRDPYFVYGGLQDNGTWGFPTRSRYQDGIVAGDVFKFGMGDGFRVVPHPAEKGLVFYTSQYGRVAWRNLLTGTGGGVKKPDPPKDAKYLFNWNTPFAISPRRPKTLWIAGNFVLRIEEDEKKSKVVSPRLGLTERGTATTLALSPRSKGLILVGTDDGALWSSRNSGTTWKALDPPAELPGPRYVASLEASHHQANTVYLAFDGHRSDDMTPWVFSSRNTGRSWQALGRGIGRGPVRALREDPVNPDLLYAGTEFGIHASLDRGRTWFDLSGNLPTVAVHDMAIQRRERELVIATHGRGLWVLDVTGLQAMTAKTRRKAVVLVQPSTAVKRPLLPARRPVGDAVFKIANPPRGVNLHFWLKAGTAEAPKLEIVDEKDAVIRTLETSGAAGVHRVFWNLRRDKKQNGRPGDVVAAGTYTVRLTSGKDVVSRKLDVVDAASDVKRATR